MRLSSFIPLVGSTPWNLPIPPASAAAAFWSLVNPFAPAATSWDDDAATSTTKVVTFLRHGCTYMNEYLGGADGGSRFGSRDFTDVFGSDEQRRKYHDTPLSPQGRKQALALHSRRPDFLLECDLVVTSPLTRALQTFDMGLRSHLLVPSGGDDCSPPEDATAVRVASVLAHPDAAERLYLVSDRGRPVHELQLEFPGIDFATCFADRDTRACWWYQRRPEAALGLEWRPTGNGQRYACASEPQEVFDERMSRLYTWLAERAEKHIVVVCHHGVIDWMLDMDFDNCQHRSVRWKDVNPRRLQTVKRPY